MPKKATKRRSWTSTDVRTLKTLARKKTHAARIAKRFEADSWSHETKSIQFRRFTRLASVVLIIKKLAFKAPRRRGFLLMFA
jgi:hypothetical protein